jgi:predicted permease
VIVIILLDNAFWHFYTVEIHQVMLILAVTPIAVKTVSYATELRVQPEKAALATLLSTLFALVTIPLAVLSFPLW